MGSLPPIGFILICSCGSAAIGVTLGFLVSRRMKVVRTHRLRLRKRLHMLEGSMLRHPMQNPYATEFGVARDLNDWEWSVDAKYAIGRGLITHQESTILANGSLAQSDLSLGLILPLSFLVWSVAVRFHGELFAHDRALVAYCVVLITVALMTASLFMVGMERRGRYELELQSLILGNAVRKAMELAPQSDNRTGQEDRP